MTQVTHGRLRWMRWGWLIVLVLFASLTAFTALDPGGGWWVPWIFGGLGIVAAGNFVWALRHSGT